MIGADDLRVTLPCASDPEGPLDLHVLGMPPAFVLSQDQTLHCVELDLKCLFVSDSSSCCRVFTRSIDGVDNVYLPSTSICVLPVVKEHPKKTGPYLGGSTLAHTDVPVGREDKHKAVW